MTLENSTLDLTFNLIGTNQSPTIQEKNYQLSFLQMELPFHLIQPLIFLIQKDITWDVYFDNAA